MAALSNPKHEAFCLEYVKDHNASEAYVRAGYSAKGAGQAAHKLLKNAEIVARIAELEAQLADKALVTTEEILSELKLIAHSDPGQLLDENGNCHTLNQMPEALRRCISSVKFSGDGGTEVRFWPKNNALELLGKYRAMWTEKVELAGKDGGPVQVAININRGKQ